MLTLHSLTCNDQSNPFGIDDPQPVLGWQMRSEQRGQAQSAYRVLVASAPYLLDDSVGDVWDSGRVESGQSVAVKYGGAALMSRTRYWWTVQVWDGAGQTSEWSEPAWFETALLDADLWQAQWIGDTQPVDSNPLPLGLSRPAPYLRKRFWVEDEPRQARAYVCGLGYHELYLNGQKVSDAVLQPAFTRYDKRALYVVYDLSDLLRAGENVVGVVLGNGLFNQSADDAWYFERAPWRAAPKLLFQAHITRDNGSEQVIGSDESWQWAAGPILADSTRLGEVYDARRELPGWCSPGGSEEGWQPVQIVEPPMGELAAQAQPPVRVMQTLAPAHQARVPGGGLLVDFGQNFAGWARVRLQGPVGVEVRLAYGENLTPGGTLDRSNIAGLVFTGEVQVDRYILKGEGIEEYEPRFTYHGFQYVQIDAPGVTVVAVEGRVIHTAFQRAGQFACSDETINRLQRCTEWSYISNFAGYPTDCPQREKNGWTGDAHLAVDAGLFNFTSAPAYRKWLQDLADEQQPDGSLPGIVPTSGWGYQWGNGPCWDSASILIPWQVYLFRGDLGVLRQFYPMMRAYLEYMMERGPGGIVRFGLGDWVPPFGDAEDYTAPLAVLATAYAFVDARILARVAALLDEPQDARRYSEYAARVRGAFNKKYYDPVSGLVAGGSQTALAMALWAGLVEEEERPKVAVQLVAEIRQQKGRINAGIHGAKAAPNALAENGFHAAALSLITQPEYPGWVWWLGQGASTLWETWDGQASRNHIMFGDISAWFYKYLAGIRPDAEQPGFRRIIIRPFMAPELEWVRAEHASPFGAIHSAWQQHTDETGTHFAMQVEIPVNTRAYVYLPKAIPGSLQMDGQALEGQNGLALARSHAGETVLDLGSGSYQFSGDAG